MSNLLILKTGSTHPRIIEIYGDFEQWFLRHLEGESDVVIRDVTKEGPPQSVSGWRGVIVTGSPAMVTDRATWSEDTAAWLREVVMQEVPVLGVCYGHQLLAHAFKGLVGFRDQGRESGTFRVSLTGEGQQDVLFGQLPQAFPAHLTHAQSVVSLPSEAILLARSEGEPNQAFRIGRHAWGVQFHPEFDGRIMRSYLNTQTSDLEREGQDPEALISKIQETTQASSLLARFARYTSQRPLSHD